MSLRFARWKHRIFRSIVLLPLSIIYYYLLFIIIYYGFTMQIVLLRSPDLRKYLGKFCTLYKSFSKIDYLGHHY